MKTEGRGRGRKRGERGEGRPVREKEEASRGERERREGRPVREKGESDKVYQQI